MKVELTVVARQDLLDVSEQGLQRYSGRAVGEYIESLKSAIRLIGEFPSISPLRDGLPENFRVRPHQAHIIIYETLPDRVIVHRIRNAREDWLSDEK